MGAAGIFCWTGLIWVSIKIAASVLRRKEHAELRPFAMALIVSFLGIAAGIFFLSYAYKQLLWRYFGLAGSMAS